MHTRVVSAFGVLLLTSLLPLPSPLFAQSGLALYGGPASWDLSGVGTGTTVAVRWDRVVAHPSILAPLSLEAGLGWFQDGQTGQGAVDLLLPEVGLRAGLPGPFDVGLGAGLAVGLEDRSGDDLTLWAALAANVGLGTDWSLRPELRVRSVDPWVGTIADYAVGVRRALN